MTKVRIDSKLSASAGDALAPLAAQLYAALGTHRLAVVELASVERNDLADDEDKEPFVKLRLVHMEVANEDQEEVLREALRSLRLHRTAHGTLTEAGDVELAASTLEGTGGRLSAIEAARLRTGLQHWLTYTRRALAVVNPAVTEIRHELDLVARGLEQLLHGPADQLPLDEAGS